MTRAGNVDMDQRPQADADPAPRHAADLPRTIVTGQVAPTQEPETLVATGGRRRNDRLALVGAAVSSLAFAYLICAQIAPFDGVLGFVVISWICFLGIYGLLVSLDSDGPAVRDRMIATIVHSLAFTLLVVLAVVVVFTLVRGGAALPHLNFFTDDMLGTTSRDPLTSGGILHAAVGTLEQITLALTITIPLGITCTVFLNELPGRFSRFVRTVVEAMTALPSIVAGLFIFATVVLILDWGKSGFAASLAISIMMLPIIIRAGDVVIRLVPGTLREASLALGASQWRTLWHVVLPTARSGLATAIILGAARGLGETSPVLLTAGYSDALNTNPFTGPQVSLPLVTFTLVRSPSPELIARGFGAGAALMALVLLLFVVARMIGGRGPGELSPGQLLRGRRASERDARRFALREQAREAVPAQPAVRDGRRPHAENPADPDDTEVGHG